MFYCENCEKTFDKPKKDTEFYEYWGERFSTDIDCCPFCGNEGIEEAKTCPICGEPMKASDHICNACYDEQCYTGNLVEYYKYDFQIFLQELAEWCPEAMQELMAKICDSGALPQTIEDEIVKNWRTYSGNVEDFKEWLGKEKGLCGRTY